MRVQCIGPTPKCRAIWWPGAVAPEARLASRQFPRARGGFPVEYREPGERRQDSGSIPQPHRWVRLCGRAGRCTEWSRAGAPLRGSRRGMCRENCGVGARQAAETLAELRRALAGRMKRIIEGRIARNPVSCVCVNYVIRRDQIADVCEHIAATMSCRKTVRNALDAWAFPPRQSLAP